MLGSIRPKHKDQETSLTTSGPHRWDGDDLQAV